MAKDLTKAADGDVTKALMEEKCRAMEFVAKLINNFFFYIR